MEFNVAHEAIPMGYFTIRESDWPYRFDDVVEFYLNYGCKIIKSDVIIDRQRIITSRFGSSYDEISGSRAIVFFNDIKIPLFKKNTIMHGQEGGVIKDGQKVNYYVACEADRLLKEDI